MKVTITNLPLPGRFKPKKKMTDIEILRFCSANEIIDLERSADGYLELRLIGGTLVGDIVMAIDVQIRQWDPSDGRGVSLAYAGFTLPDGSLLSPAFAWVDRESWDASDKDGKKFFWGAPYFLIEIVSLSRSLPMLRAKMKLWIKSGVHVAWLVEPDTESVTIYRKDGAAELVRGATEVKGEGLMKGLVLNLRTVWERPPPKKSNR